MNTRFDSIDTHLALIDVRLEKIESRLDKLEKQINLHNRSIAEISVKLERLEVKIYDLEDKVDRNYRDHDRLISDLAVINYNNFYSKSYIEENFKRKKPYKTEAVQSFQ
jgi:chromosome segregation ATPase